MTLGERQEMFTYLLAELILFIYGRGYKVRMGEVLRIKAQAEANAASGAGISNSLHLDKLAADLNLFREGTFLTETEDHREFGEFWKSLHPDCCWGGDFSKPDGNHYSLSFDGRK
jgi:hypothetical protein